MNVEFGCLELDLDPLTTVMTLVERNFLQMWISRSERANLLQFWSDNGWGLPYDEFDLHKLRLAMKIGRHYRVRNIRIRDWEHLAIAARMDSTTIVEHIADLASRVPHVSSAMREQCVAEGLRHEVIARLHERVTARARECLGLVERMHSG